MTLRPGWHSNDPAQGAIKVVMTGSAADEALLQSHIYNNATKKLLERRFKDAADPLKLVIVRDMWLAGFDVPCLHTMYIDKPMRDHNLMQAIARVNRVFRDKEGGLVVDHIGIAAELRSALRSYTESKGKGPGRSAGPMWCWKSPRHFRCAGRWTRRCRCARKSLSSRQ